jgi:hypothetical protein
MPRLLEGTQQLVEHELGRLTIANMALMEEIERLRALVPEGQRLPGPHGPHAHPHPGGANGARMESAPAP